jgi:hypothetical protein
VGMVEMRWREGKRTYHRNSSELLDLLDRAGCSLLELDAMNLWVAPG